MKTEWKKDEKKLYLPKNEAEQIIIPKQKFLIINGKGNPNSQDFADRIGVLYSLAYAIRMMPKNGYTPEGYVEYTVYPLEGLWDLSEEGRQKDAFSKEELVYRIMIRQPEFVTEDVVKRAFEITRKKKPNILLDEVTFETLNEGLCVQIMHIGSYDDEPASFEKMKKYISENELEIESLVHREIYVKAVRGEPKEGEVEKQKTVLRYRVVSKG